MVTVMYNLVSQLAMMQVNDDLAVATICKVLEGQNLVCPPILGKSLFTQH